MSNLEDVSEGVAHHHQRVTNRQLGWAAVDHVAARVEHGPEKGNLGVHIGDHDARCYRAIAGSWLRRDDYVSLTMPILTAINTA